SSRELLPRADRCEIIPPMRMLIQAAPSGASLGAPGVFPRALKALSQLGVSTHAAGASARNSRRRSLLPFLFVPLVFLISAATARAGLTITPTFDASLTAPEIAVINQAIAFYQSTFSNPINVTIYFEDISSGL